MDDSNGGDRGPRGRSRPGPAGMLAAGLAGVAVLAAACSGGGSAGSAEPAPQPGFQKALAYAACMRSHGAPSYPDPNSQGQFIQTPANRAEFSAPASADKACQHLVPDGGLITAAEQRDIAPVMLKFAACMRAHGITNFPDPIVNAQGIAVNPQGLDLSSPPFQSAQQACRTYLREAGRYMPDGW